MVRNWLFPRFPLAELPSMLAIAAVGGVCAGLFGIVHDLVTFSIGPEYFTKLKFHQFAWANLGLPPRWFAAEIGLLASWWVGVVGGWFIARAGAARLPPSLRWPLVVRSVALIVAMTTAGGLAGGMYGSYVARSSDLAEWQEIKAALRLSDLPSFIVVAYVHYGSYGGALTGIVAGSILASRAAKRHLRAT
jgi:hypothetical protein